MFSGFRIHTVQIGFKFDLSGICVLSVCLPVCRSEIGLMKPVGGSDIDFIQYHSIESAKLQINSLIMIGTKIMENSKKNNVHKSFLSGFSSVFGGLYRLK